MRITKSESRSWVVPAVLLTVILVILKLTGVIPWSWWVVFLPSLALIGLGLLALFFLAIAYLLMDRK